MHFQRLLLLFIASNSGKRYWDWTLPRIRSQIELWNTASHVWYITSSTFVYDYKMSTSGSSTKNSHLTHGGWTTMIGYQLLFSFLANFEFSSPENSNLRLLLPGNHLFLKFPNNFTAEFWATLSYGLLLQQFFWNFSDIFIMSMNDDTRNYSKKYQQNFLLATIFFEH